MLQGIQLDFAEYWLSLIATTQFQSEQEAYIKRARKGFVAALKLDDSMPETYAMYGQTYLLDGTNNDKAIEMFEQAARLHPSSGEIRSMLTEAYARAGRNGDALRQAQLILSWGHDNNGPARLARSIIDQLENDGSESGALLESSNR